MIRLPVGRFERGGKGRRAAARRLWIPHVAPNVSRGAGAGPWCWDASTADVVSGRRRVTDA
jgi:hypothetical protein